MRSPGSIGGWCAAIASWCGSAGALIKFRRSQPTLRREIFLTGKPHAQDSRPDVNWFDNRGQPVHWESGAADA